MDDRDPLHRVQVVLPGPVGEQAVVRRRHHRDTGGLHRPDNYDAAAFAEAPPTLQRGIAVGAGQHDRCSGQDAKRCAQGLVGNEARGASAAVEHPVELQRYRTADRWRLARRSVVENRNHQWERRSFKYGGP